MRRKIVIIYRACREAQLESLKRTVLDMNNRVLFLISKGVSYVGTKLFSFALSWYILKQTGSGLGFSISLLVNYIPSIVFSMIAGRISDRLHHPNKMLVVCDIASAITCALLLLFFSLPAIYCAIFILSCISALFNNAIDAHLPNLDGIEDAIGLKKLASSSQFITSGVNILAPAVGGVLIGIIPVKMFVIINIGSFLASAFGELFLKYSVKELSSSKNQSEKKIHSTFLWLLKNKDFRPFLFGDGLVNFCMTAGISVSVPFIITNTLGLSSGSYGVITGFLGFGSVLSALYQTKHPCKTELKYPYVKVGSLGIIMLLIGLITWLPYHQVFTTIALCIMEFIVGWLSVAINIKTITTIQIFVQDDLRGKVIGTLTAVSYSLIPISLLLTGAAVDMIKSYAIPLICGGLLVVLLGCIKLLDLRVNNPAQMEDN